MPPASSLLEKFSRMEILTYPSVTGPYRPITLHSLAAFVWACTWAMLLLISFAGWGRLAARVCRIERLPSGIACSLGIAVVILLGGPLNLLHAIYPLTLFAIFGAGLLFHLLPAAPGAMSSSLSTLWRGAAPWARALLIVTVVIVALRAAATVRLDVFDAIDDGPAYLPIPKAMLAHHFFFTGPFSDRHIISSVGGGYWLQVFVLAATSLSNIGMADRTLGLVLLFALLWDVGIEFGLSVEQIAVVEFLTYLVPQPTANLTFVVLPTALLLAVLWFLYRSLDENSVAGWRLALLAGGVGGAAVALKSTFLPCVGSYCLFPYLLMGSRNRKKVLGFPIIAGLGALLVVAAWMIAMKHSVGTYLFPVLGRGIDYSNYGVLKWFAIPKTTRTILKLFIQGFGLVALAVLTFSFGRRKQLLFCASVLIAAAVGITAFNLAAGGDSIWRYGFPQFFSAILIFAIAMAAASREIAGDRRRRAAWALSALSLVACIFYYDVSGKNPDFFRQVKFEFEHYGGALHASLSGRALASPAILDEYQRLQSAVPRDGAVLETVAYPFLLNQKLHTVFLMDWPGAAGPAPGWSFTPNTEPLVNYLRSNGVRYILYDYRYGQWLDINSCAVLERPQAYSTELYVLFWMALLTHNQLDDLRGQYRSVYDDGTIAAIDLDSPAPNAPVQPPVWTLSTKREEMCSTILSQYVAGPLPKGKGTPSR